MEGIEKRKITKKYLNELSYQIIGKGKRIFCNDPIYCDFFETTIYSAYVRFNDERRELLDDIKKRGQIYNG